MSKENPKAKKPFPDDEDQKPFIVKTYGKGELAALFEITTQTMRRWLKKLGIDCKKTKLLTIKEVLLIISHLGTPGNRPLEDYKDWKEP